MQINTTASRFGAQYTFLLSTDASIAVWVWYIYSTVLDLPLHSRLFHEDHMARKLQSLLDILLGTDYSEHNHTISRLSICEVIERLPQEFRYSTHPTVVNESNQLAHSVGNIYIYIYIYMCVCVSPYMQCPCEGELTNHTLLPVRHTLRPKKHLSIEYIMHHGAIRLQHSVR